MTDQALDDLARRVILDAARQEYGDWIDQLPEHDFPPKFERKMKKLIRRANHPIRYRVAQIVACLLLTALLSGCAVLAVSPEAREAFTNWVRKVDETGYIYRFFGPDREVLTEEMVIYRPTYIPSGYQMSEEFVRNGKCTITYRNGPQKMAIFSYYYNIGSGAFFVESDGTETYKQVLVNGIYAEMYLDPDEGEASVLIWMDENGEFIFRISAPVSEAELIKMAESVSAVQSSDNEEAIP